MLETESLKYLQGIRQKTGGDKKIVFVSGFFNIVHPGHLRLLRFAAECGDFLVVGIYGDNLGEPLIGENLRYEGVKAISLVDYVFILKSPSEEFIKELKPSIVVKGKEHENSINPEADVVASYGGKMLFGSGDISFSLVELLQDESQRIVSSSLVKNDAYIERHGFSWKNLEKVLKKFQQLKALVIGDVIVDEYITCDPLGMSQEDPTIVVSPVGTELYIGGAGIVAAHASNLGADVSFFSITGSDEIAGFVKEKLEDAKVKAFLLEDETRPTILKQRYRSSGKTLFRVNHLRQHPISKEIQKRLQSHLVEIIKEQDVIIFSDFNYGCLPQPLVDSIIQECKKNSIMMVADSQSSSQVGDISRFTDMVLLTPTEREARLALKDFESGLVVLAEKLRQTSRAKNIFITLDKEGLLIHADVKTRRKDSYLTDQLEAMNNNPVDPAGAGDSLLICSALALASGADIWQSAYLGSVAAACQIGRNGNIPLSVSDMYPGTHL